MNPLVFDTEGDGLLEDTTRLWCIVAKDYYEGTIQQFGPEDIEAGIDYLCSAPVLICHNLIKHDLAVIEKLYDRSYDGVVIDSLVWSRVLNPDRKIPKGCPARGPHSVEAWGYRLGRWKPEHEDWSQYSPEMLHRCTEDTEIQYLLFQELLKEAGTTLEEFLQ